MKSNLVKVLTPNGQVFPQTVAEAVLVNGEEVTTLDKVLPKKVETIITTQDSGLSNFKQGTSVILTHSNKITPNDTPEACLIQYDQNGHIVKTEPIKVQQVVVNGLKYTQYNGNTDSNIQFGDDFKIVDNQITLTWGEV